MTFKTLLLSSSFLLASNVYAEADVSPTISYKKNLCDDLIANAKPEAAIKKCLENKKIGPSDYYKEQQKDKLLKAQNEEAQEAAGEAKTAAEMKRKKELADSVEEKTFSESELNDMLAMPFFASKEIWKKNGSKIDKEERITTGDALCSFLGYEKSKSYRVSNVGASSADKNGYIIPTNGFGIVKAPQFFKDDKDNYVIKKYTSITCAKPKKDAALGKEAMAEIVETLEGTGSVATAAKDTGKIKIGQGDKSNKVDDTPRTSAGFGFKRPAYAADDEDEDDKSGAASK